MPNASDLLRDHTTLSIRSIDRLYLAGYLPTMVTSPQVRSFVQHVSGKPIPSPALLKPRHDRFVRSVHEFAESNSVPLVEFQRGQRKDDVAAMHRSKVSFDDGVVFVGSAQERFMGFRGAKIPHPSGGVDFAYTRSSCFVKHYYFYLLDAQWGPAFIKVAGYVPYPARVCLNGHEWAKRQLLREGIAFQSLDNGFQSCAEPERLQQICDSLGPDNVISFYQRWIPRLPWPLSAEERKEGHERRLSIWQLEASQTDVFRNPAQGRAFFDALMADNLDLGRPDRVSVCFPTRLTRATPMPRHGYQTRVVSVGVIPTLHASFKSVSDARSRVDLGAHAN